MIPHLKAGGTILLGIFCIFTFVWVARNYPNGVALIALSCVGLLFFAAIIWAFISGYIELVKYYRSKS